MKQPGIGEPICFFMIGACLLLKGIRLSNSTV